MYTLRKVFAPYAKEGGLGYPWTMELFRMLFFGTLAVDLAQSVKVYNRSFLLIPHLDWLLPYTLSMPYPSEVTFCANTISFSLAVLLMAGRVRHRAVELLLFVVMASAYCISIMDTFQHHYLFIMLVLLVALGDPYRCREIILLQTSILYFWTTITKLTSPSFLTGSYMRDVVLMHHNIDSLLGSTLYVWFDFETAEWLYHWALVLSSWAVVGLEGALCVNLLRQPFSWLNTLMMTLLHGPILLMEMFLPSMHTDLFSVYMFALALLTVPEVGWVRRYLISNQRMRTLTNDSRRRMRGRRVRTFLLVVFFLGQMLLPMTYYVPWNEDPLDERFAWRMFSDLSNRNCVYDIVVQHRNETLSRPTQSEFSEFIKVGGMLRHTMSGRLLRVLSHATCHEVPTAAKVLYRGQCRIVQQDIMVALTPNNKMMKTKCP